MITETQRAIRATGIGGSDMAAILGLCKYRTPFDVWQQKTGRWDEREESEAAYWGTVLEDAVANRFSEVTGLSVRRDNQTRRHRDCHVMLGHIDRKIEGLREGLECKTIGAWKGATLADPLEAHVIQCQHYLEVLDYERWHIAYLIGGQRFAHWTIDRDRELGADLRAAAEHFWSQYVERDMPPPIDASHPVASGAIARLYPGTDGSTVDLPDDLSHWAEVRAQAKAEIARLETVCDAADNRIRLAMREAAIGRIPGWEFKRKLVSRKGYTVADTSYMTLTCKRKGEAE